MVIASQWARSLNMTEHNSPRIFVAGHRGMVGNSIVKCLQQKGYRNIVTQTKEQLDLCDQAQVQRFFSQEKIDQVYIAAAKVGGIHANKTYPADFIYTNLMIESNLIHQSYLAGIDKLLFLGSSCIYPKLAAQPMTENALLSGPLEPTNEPYAIAKIAGIKLCESYNRQYDTDFRSVMPTNLYGPGDNYHPENSHVIPGLIRRFHEAKMSKAPAVKIWGTGSPKREFLYVEDLAEACFFIMELDKRDYHSKVSPMQNHINIGYNSDITISELARFIKEVTGFQGAIEFDLHKPDGPPKKLMDSSLITDLGWQATTPLKRGLEKAYHDFLNSNQ